MVSTGTGHTETSGHYGHSGTATVSTPGSKLWIAFIVLVGFVGLSYPLMVFLSVTPRWVIIGIVLFVAVAGYVIWREYTASDERMFDASASDRRASIDGCDHLERLKAQYARGDIDEAALRRELEGLEADGSLGSRIGHVAADDHQAFEESTTTTASIEITQPDVDISTLIGDIKSGNLEDNSVETSQGQSRATTSSTTATDQSSNRSAPETLLRHRFAEGELTEVEFERKLQLLRESADGKRE